MTQPASKLVLITGATSGIGRQTARDIAHRGHRLILHGRSQDSLEEAARELAEASGGEAPEVVCADLASLDGVRQMAEALRDRFAAIDVLVNNAGVYMNERRLTADGYEMTFAVNHLAPFLLTHLLLDQLRGAGGRARVVNVSSIAHNRGRLDFDNLQAELQFDPYEAYSRSKLANVLFTVELARRLGPEADVAVNALHPGVVSTKLLTEGFGVQGSDSLEEGARTSVYLATAPEVEGVSGRYFKDCRQAPMNPVARDEALSQKFYDVSCEMCGIEGLRLPD